MDAKKPSQGILYDGLNSCRYTSLDTGGSISAGFLTVATRAGDGPRQRSDPGGVRGPRPSIKTQGVPSNVEGRE